MILLLERDRDYLRIEIDEGLIHPVNELDPGMRVPQIDEAFSHNPSNNQVEQMERYPENPGTHCLDMPVDSYP